MEFPPQVLKWIRYIRPAEEQPSTHDEIALRDIVLHACPKSVQARAERKGYSRLRRISALKQESEASEAEGMSLYRSVSCLTTHRKIENAALLLNPLNELDVKHDFQRFWTVMIVLIGIILRAVEETYIQEALNE